jgi:hypothetical protein
MQDDPAVPKGGWQDCCWKLDDWNVEVLGRA